MKSIPYYFLLLIIIINYSIEGTKNPVKDLFPEYDGDIYTGYLKTLREGDELFYIYAPSQSSTPSSDPVILWLNGGPGCSSLFGFLGEVGPVVTDNYSGVWKKNPYSWNTNANLVAIEQPAGVGFSKAKDPDYLWTDDVDADNLLSGIKDFIETFPELRGRPFYVSGESYAGVYIPFLATHALEDESEDKINLKGVLIGNGLTDFKVDSDNSMAEFGYARGLISEETYRGYERNCPHLPDEINPYDPTWEDKNNLFELIFDMSLDPKNVTQKCNKYRRQISDDFNGNDIYGIYRLCRQYKRRNNQLQYFDESHPLYLNQKFSYRSTILRRLSNKNKYININDYLNKNTNTNQKLNEALEPQEDVWPNEGCMDDFTFDIFLNDENNKKKMKVYNESIIWSQCGGINYEMGESLKFYNETMKKYKDVIDVWFFSGTDDGVLGTLGTMRWIQKLGLTIETKFRQWKCNDQIAGFVQKYKEGLTLVTVKGAGHMVPQDRRAEAKVMFDAFINGRLP